jgi:hypothetical protein
MNARSIACCVACACACAAHATEGGATAFPNGGEDFLVAAMPPPGFYSQVYATRYSAGRLAGNSGDLPLERFDLTVKALTPRFDWVRPAAAFGADRWGTLVVLPYLDIDLALSPAPGVAVRGSRKGFGDLTVGNGLHWGLGAFEMVNALDVVIPTGGYERARLVNTGRNQWVLRLNHMGTWFAAPQWDLSYRLHWDRNFENPDTEYRSGQTAYLNYAIGWKPTGATTLGIAGYFLKQITDDRGPGAPVDGNRVAVRGFGPVVKHFFPGGISLTAKYFRESAARNGPRGESFWLYAGFPL